MVRRWWVVLGWLAACDRSTDGKIDDEPVPDIDEDADGWTVDEDRDDRDAAVSPGITEALYNGVDDDCDALTPDDDVDGDGFLIADDCDDSDPTRSPDAHDLPRDGLDQDCDGIDQCSVTTPGGDLVLAGPGAAADAAAFCALRHGGRPPRDERGSDRPVGARLSV